MTGNGYLISRGGCAEDETFWKTAAAERSLARTITDSRSLRVAAAAAMYRSDENAEEHIAILPAHHSTTTTATTTLSAFLFFSPFASFLVPTVTMP